MSSSSPSNDLEVNFVAGLLFQVLDSIRYAQDVFNPRYVSLETRIKLRTTRELKALAKAAARVFCEETRRNPGKYVDQQSIESLKATAIEQALARRESRK
ncbi:MAG TPA: hypothetical protein VGG03_12930 [Thermoanaerobaculia bacterium]|jgi:hypothetical protein